MRFRTVYYCGLQSTSIHSAFIALPSTHHPTQKDCVDISIQQYPITLHVNPPRYITTRRGALAVRQSLESSVYESTEKRRRIKSNIIQIIPLQLKRFARIMIGKQNLPRSRNIADVTSLLRQFAKFVLYLLLETFAIVSVLTLISIHHVTSVDRKFVITNLCRYLTISIFIKMGILHSRITSSVPSLTRDETNDWFLKGSYQVICDDNNSNSYVEVKIRQVPENGACLFNAIAAGILYYDNNAQADDISHPTISKVIECSSTLRTLAVDALANGIKSNAQLVMQNDEVISTAILIHKAASQYGLTSEEYLSNMRSDNVWGGGPEIVALANSLNRQIVLLELVAKDDDVFSLKVTARFGPPQSTEHTIYILSTNIKFPNDFIGKKSNHFLAVFPSRLF